MCMSQPRAPRVVQQGPSQQEMQAYQQQLAAYQQQAQAQSEAFQAQLQRQIDATTLQTQQAQQQAAAMATAAPVVAQGAYEVATSQGQPGPGAQVTEAIEQRQSERSSLRIAPASTAAMAGTGLNIGV